ncbi:hypothetical protein JCM8208_000475 [Rhodotorula glutinis]
MASTSSSAPPERTCAHCHKAASQLEPAVKLMRCSACKVVFYCSREEQTLDWKRHQPACLSRRHAEPYIAHIDFGRSTTDHSPWFEPVFDAITPERSFVTVANSAELRSLLSHPILPSAILSTTAALAEKQHANVRAALRIYIEKGGRVVVGGPGIGHLMMDEIPVLLSELGGVPWQVGGYHRTTHYLNTSHPLYRAVDSPARAALSASFSCKAIVLKEVDPSDMVYRSTGDSGVESLAMAMGGGKVASDEVAVATAQVGEGWLSWVGDVNQEAGSTAAMLWLLGVKR